MRTTALMLTAAAVLLGGGAARAEEPVGDWGGLLAGSIHVIFHVRRTPDGRYEASTESPDQGDAVIPADKVEASGDHLSLTIPRIGASYAAAWDSRQQAWVGTLTQGRDIPLTVRRLDAAALAAMRTPPRPQDQAAQAALPLYRPEAVRVENPKAPGVALAGVFSKPPGPGPFPAVLLIAGSGPQTRDEEVVRHRVFLVLADELNRRGVAVLRYDKRGVGGSIGDLADATTTDFASDAAAVFRYLAGRPDVDPKRLGLIGHSEGGAIAPMVAGEDPAVAFVVLMAGPGQRGAEILRAQQQLIAEAEGAPAAAVAAQDARNRAIFGAILAASDRQDAQRRVAALSAPAEPGAPAGAGGAARLAQVYTTPWMFEFLRLDPAPALARLRVPVLAIAGSHDLQVPAKANLAAIRSALKDDRDVTVAELPGLNHLFQTAATGAPSEYGRIEETLSPTALRVIGDWVTAHVQPAS